MADARLSDFYEVPESEWIVSNELAFAVKDSDPVSPGHILVVPRRPVATWWDATIPERNALMMLVDQLKEQLDRTMSPDGYNVGFNTGEAAGQTAAHLSIHFIPRFRSPETPTAPSAGGIRQVVPNAMLASPKRTRRA